MKIKLIKEIISKYADDDEIFCLIYEKEDADTTADDITETILTAEQWLNVVTYMETDDYLFETAHQTFGIGVDKQLQKGVKNAN